MEARKWEELPSDCLVDVLGRVGLESLLVDVPFVCKSWYKATLSPYCWKELNFPHISSYSYGDSFTSRFEDQYGLHGGIFTTKFLKVVIDRSAGCATRVKLPFCYEIEALTYVADKCPALKNLVLHSQESSMMFALSVVIGKFKNLESLVIESDYLFKDIVTEIGAHCENFVVLGLFTGGFPADIREKVMAIVSCLPKIKGLALRGVWIQRENLIEILKGCVELEHLDVGDCRGFDENDEEILKLASHIPTFNCSGSLVYPPLSDYDYFDDYLNSHDIDSDFNCNSD